MRILHLVYFKVYSNNSHMVPTFNIISFFLLENGQYEYIEEVFYLTGIYGFLSL